MYPHSQSGPDREIAVSKVQAVERVDRYCRRAGLQTIAGHPGFLAQGTAFVHLGNARRQLASVRPLRSAALARRGVSSGMMVTNTWLPIHALAPVLIAKRRVLSDPSRGEASEYGRTRAL
jgi:hypothetical protein